jgi:hypothetical protein
MELLLTLMDMYRIKSFNKSTIKKRLIEIIPGLLIWMLILLPVIGHELMPLLVINFIILITVFYSLKGVASFVGIVIGFFRYREATTTDYLQKIYELDIHSLSNYNELSEDKLPYHLIVIANYGEDYDVLSRSINSIIHQNYPIEKIFVAVSIEYRKAKIDTEYAKRYDYLKKDFGQILEDRLLFYVHPDDIPGEVIGASANRTWGTKNAVEELEKRNYDISKFLITAPDGDIVFSKSFLANCTYEWLKADKRNQKFYQTAVYTFNNNYWNVPILIRVLSTSLTVAVLGSSIVEKFRRETFSCYTLNLKVMKDVNYWDTSLGIDDTTFYWRPYKYFNGDWHCEVFFSPLSADAVYNHKYLKNHIDQYAQYVRWGWGVISFPIAMEVLFSRNSKISLFERLWKLVHLFDVFILSKVVAFLMAFGIPILLILNTSLDDSVLSVYSATTISSILSLLSLLLLPLTLIKLYLIPAKPKKMSWLKFSLIILIEMPLNFVVGLTYSFFPFVEATTRMMLGQEHAKQVKWSNKKLTK